MEYNTDFVLGAILLIALIFDAKSVYHLYFLHRIVVRSQEKKLNRYYSIGRCVENICTDDEKEFFKKSIKYINFSWKSVIFIISTILIVYLSMLLVLRNIVDYWALYTSIALFFFSIGFFFVLKTDIMVLFYSK